MKKLIIYGGSFDPITNAHMRIARGACFLLNSDLVFVPSKSPRWKNVTADIEHRVNMLHLAINEFNLINVSISDYEVNSNDEINYSIDTILHFKEIYKDTKLYFLIGADQVNQFDKWKEAKKISDLTNIVFIKREGLSLDTDNIKRFKMTELDIKGIGDASSTKVRELVSLDVPFSVLKYIEDNNLYYMSKIKSYYEERRFEHAKSVANLCYKIAESNNLDKSKAYIAGLLHDVGKIYDDEKSIEIINTEFPEYKDIGKFSVHQFVGAYLAKTEFAINDNEIFEAIKYHASGSGDMGIYSQIVYAADKIDPLRGYDSSDMINACLRDASEGFKYVLKENKRFLESKGRSINNSLTVACFNKYLKENK